ncbi:Fc.00g032540.m01.CDS01 [Cosmosporella sp. VM-42]
MASRLLQHLDTEGWSVSQPSDLPDLIAERVFRKALEETKSTCNDEFLTRWQSSARVEDVVESLEESERKSLNRGNGKAWKWATRLSSRIMFYSQILDVIAQHHPEYVSLAWGTIKFLLVGVLNYEIMMKELCKALCRIANALQHVQLSLLLYPNQVMQEHVARLYTHIIEFTTRAIKWYEKRRTLKVLSALSSPFQLKFRDIVDDILETVRCIDRVALSMSQVEVRQIRLEIAETNKLAKEIKTALETYSQLHYSGLIDTNRRISEVQFSQIIDFISKSSLPDPVLIRQRYASKRKLRRRGGHAAQYHPSLGSTQLQQWGETQESSQILIQGSFRDRHITRDVAIDMIDLISNAGVPVVWALDPTIELTSLFTSVDVLKYIASQILKSNHAMLNERSAALSAARFQSVTTESGWFELLGSVMEGLRQLYVIIDVELLNKAECLGLDWLAEFPRLFDSLSSNNAHVVVKVAFVSPLGTQLDSDGGTFARPTVTISSKKSTRIAKSAARGLKIGRGTGRKNQKKLLAALQRGNDGAAI